MASPNKAQEATDQMFALVGRAIIQWSFVEQTLSNIFIICASPCPVRLPSEEDNGFTSFIDSQVPTAVFYAIESFRGKLSLVDAALLARIPEYEPWGRDLREEWGRLKDKVRKLSQKRNALAHWTVIPAFQGEEFRDAALMPPFGSPGWWKETGINSEGKRKKPMHIQHMCKAFELIDEKLRTFSKRLAHSEELSGIYDELTVRLIHSHDRLNPTRGEWIRRALSWPV